MGFNSLVFINNDALHMAQTHAVEFMEQVNHHIQFGGPYPKTFPFHSYSNYFEVSWCAHSSQLGLILVGGNKTEILAQGGKTLDLLREAADQFGYKLIKKSKRDYTSNKKGE